MKLTETASGHTRRQEAKRAAILSAATKIFLKEGYGRTSMDWILAEVGGSKRTLYNHFKSKDDLFEAIVTDVSNRVLAALKLPVDTADIRQALITMGVRYLDVLLSPEGLALYRAMVSEAPHFPELAQAFFANGPGRASTRLSEIFQEQTDAGVLKMADPVLSAEQFLGMLRGNIHFKAVLSLSQPSRRQVDEAVALAVETFLAGATPRKP